MATITTDRSIQLNAFEETKTGVKGLVDSGITEVPAIFRAPTVVLDNLKPPPASQLTIPTVDLKGGRVFLKKQEGSVTRRGVVVKIGDAAEKWGFFQVVNHGIPLDKMEKMREGIRGFHEQDTESKKRFYLAITPENGFTTATSISTPLGLRAGEIPSLISNDKFISVEHRVVANGAAEPRISVPCFFSSIMKANPREYGPIKELLSEQNPPNYRELTISEFSNMYGTKELNTSALHHFKI
ncbi:hypothetical protein HID58_035847 [Brassica napus]|uniref:Non-haem dioxygenase N-terminal domain-containing protein n=1 Tax=Brassica napus TaxID=3708 RepID=A0ABQ8C627_BRANA|nr:hypothetical protein HID58_035847 [Brassica napus]